MRILPITIFIISTFLNYASAFEECGSTLATFNGVPAKSNGSFTGRGESCESDRGTYGWEYQCVEYVKRYYATELNHDISRWNKDAAFYFDFASRFGLDAYPNGSFFCSSS